MKKTEIEASKKTETLIKQLVSDTDKKIGIGKCTAKYDNGEQSDGIVLVWNKKPKKDPGPSVAQLSALSEEFIDMSKAFANILMDTDMRKNNQHIYIGINEIGTKRKTNGYQMIVAKRNSEVREWTPEIITYIGKTMAKIAKKNIRLEAKAAQKIAPKMQ